MTRSTKTWATQRCVLEMKASGGRPVLSSTPRTPPSSSDSRAAPSAAVSSLSQPPCPSGGRLLGLLLGETRLRARARLWEDEAPPVARGEHQDLRLVARAPNGDAAAARLRTTPPLTASLAPATGRRHTRTPTPGAKPTRDAPCDQPAAVLTVALLLAAGARGQGPALRAAAGLQWHHHLASRHATPEGQRSGGHLRSSAEAAQAVGGRPAGRKGARGEGGGGPGGLGGEGG